MSREGVEEGPEPGGVDPFIVVVAGWDDVGVWIRGGELPRKWTGRDTDGARPSSIRRTSISSRPSDWMRSSTPCNSDWSRTAPRMTVSAGLTAALKSANAPQSESLSLPLMRIS